MKAEIYQGNELVETVANTWTARLVSILVQWFRSKSATGLGFVWSVPNLIASLATMTLQQFRIYRCRVDDYDIRRIAVRTPLLLRMEHGKSPTLS